MNHWALWRSSDSFVTNTLGRRLGIKQLGEIFDDLELGPHDHVWVDLSGMGPKLRKNLTHVITINEYKKITFQTGVGDVRGTSENHVKGYPL